MTFDPYGFEKRLKLRPVARLVKEDGYEGEHFAVWRDENEHLYYGSGSHCSCNEPFDNVKALSDLKPAKDFNEVWRGARAWQDDNSGVKADEVTAFRGALLEALAEIRKAHQKSYWTEV